MTQARNRFPAREVCLEARIAASDLVPVHASVQRWVEGREGAGGRRAGQGGTTFSLRAGPEGGLSVFLRASGEDALRLLAGHGSDLVGALAEAPGEVALTWIRHQRPERRLAAVSTG